MVDSTALDNMLRQMGSEEDRKAYNELRERVHLGIWQMKNGSQIHIKDMGSCHLLNTINMIERGKKRNLAPYIEYLRQMNAELSRRAEESSIGHYPEL